MLNNPIICSSIKSLRLIIIYPIIHVEPEEWLVPITDKYPALEKQHKMFEPAKNHSYNCISSNLEPVRTSWLGREDSNQ